MEEKGTNTKVRAKGKKTTFIMLIMVALVMGYYYYLSSKNSEATSQENIEATVEESMTPVQELLARVPYREYPTTPVQVLKYYNEITACFYNETYSDEELSELAHLAQSLYDNELVLNQSQDEYLSNLRDDIAVFKSGNITVYSSEVTPSTDVEYFTFEERECARLYCTYTLKSGTVYQSSREVYVLRKDDEGHWKILGFALVTEDEEAGE